jgi:hypothetical protein
MPIDCHQIASIYVLAIMSSPNALVPSAFLAQSGENCRIHVEANKQNQNITVLMTGGVQQRIMAAQKLGEDRDRQAVPALIKSLKDPNLAVRGYAAWALGKIKDDSAVEPLIEALQERMDAVREQKIKRAGKGILTTSNALESITGEKYGFDVEKWKDYVKRVKEKKQREGGIGK